MHEGPPNTFEKGPETIPTPEEIKSVFEQLIEKRESIKTYGNSKMNKAFTYGISLFPEKMEILSTHI